MYDFADYAAQGIASGIGTAALTGAAAYRAYKNNKMTKPTAYSNARNINTLAQQVRRNRGEVKTAYTVAGTVVLGSTASKWEPIGVVDQGDGPTTRDGNRIRIVGWDVRIHTSNPQVDTYLINSVTGQDVQGTNFHNVIGGHINANSRSDFKCYSVMRNSMRSQQYDRHHSKKLKRGITVRFNGPLYTDCVMNKLQVFMINRTTTSATLDYSIIVYYTDN